jgi:uncharacterized protein
MTIGKFKWHYTIFASAFLFSVGAASAGEPAKMLVVSVTKGFRHDVIPETDQMLTDLSKSSGKFTVDFVKTDADMAEKMTASALTNIDGVIFNNTTGDLPLPDRDAFLKWIKSGKAFVGLHAATDTFPGFPDYIDMIGAQFKTHGDQVEVKAIIEDRFHPATRHFDAFFRVFDEIYQVQNFYRDRVHGLITMDRHPNTGVPGDYPIAWCKSYGQGRVFYTSLGHRTDVVNRADFQKHVLMGILWALGLESGDADPQSKEFKVTEDESKLEFKPLFNGVDLTGWRLRNPDGRPSWSVQNGMLVNTVTETEHGTDLVSEDKYADFIVRYEYLLAPGANSGFYLRGRHELQILDDTAQAKPSKSGDGAFYNFVAPSRYASLKAGEWNQVEVSLKTNRVTVILNGIKIHDNLLLDRATGGELDSQLTEPGPILLQGDHGSVAFRKIRLKRIPTK